MGRRLFCEISPTAYRISVMKQCFARHMSDLCSCSFFASDISTEPLEFCVYKNRSLMRRQLGNVDMHLQENKVVNLSLAAPAVNGILIHPGQTFSFWRLVGATTQKKGYKTGLILKSNAPAEGIGGGMCQFTNLIHWLVLHSPLEITEHHHHDGVDLFPDYGRQIPFGSGTSIYYNYLDYRFTNPTKHTFQLITYVTDTHLCGELRCDSHLDRSYHICTEGEAFVKRADGVYRTGRIYRETYDKESGNLLLRELIKENNAKVMYNTDGLDVVNEQKTDPKTEVQA